MGPGLAVLRFIGPSPGLCFIGPSPGLCFITWELRGLPPDGLFLSPLILRRGEPSRLELTGIEATVRESRLLIGLESFIFPNKSPSFPSSSPGFTVRSPFKSLSSSLSSWRRLSLLALPVCSLSDISSLPLGFFLDTGIEVLRAGGITSSSPKGSAHLSAAEKIAFFRSFFDCLELIDFFRSMATLFIRFLVASSSRIETSSSSWPCVMAGIFWYALIDPAAIQTPDPDDGAVVSLTQK